MKVTFNITYATLLKFSNHLENQFKLKDKHKTYLQTIF